MSILPEYINKSYKVLTQEKNRIRNSSTTISTASLNNNYFKIFTSILLNCSFKVKKITLHKKYFLRIYWDMDKTKIKEGKYDYCKSN